MNTTRSKGAGKGRIDVKKAEMMLRAGKTQVEVAEEMGVSQASVSQAIKRGRINFHTGVARRNAVPWKLEPEDMMRYIPRMLRAAARMDDGEPVSPATRTQVELFVRRLHELDAVVHYQPDTDERFFRVPRRHGVDEWLVREPALDDEGNLIPGADPRALARVR